MQFGVFERSIYHKHEITNHQLLPAGSLWRLLRIPRELPNLRTRLIAFPLEGFIPSSTLINSVAQLLFSMVPLHSFLDATHTHQKKGSLLQALQARQRFHSGCNVPANVDMMSTQSISSQGSIHAHM